MSLIERRSDFVGFVPEYNTALGELSVVTR